MKISSSIRSHGTKAAYRGFTLIELLVVISIIAVLAGLLFPAMGAVRTMARKTSAKNDITQIVNAVKMYYTEYGRYPLVNDSGQFTTNNGALINVLRYGGSGADTMNPRKIRFLEVPTAKNKRSGLEVANDTATPAETANWLDPWGRGYMVFISEEYDGKVTPTGLPKAKDGANLNTEIQTEVVAASMGPDNSKGQAPTSGSSGFDPVASWR